MMQILENIPGITVERCSLLDRTYTCPTQDVPRDKVPRRRLDAKEPAPRPDMPRRRESAQKPRGKTRATAHSVSDTPSAPRRDVVRPMSRDKPPMGYFARPHSGRGSKQADMEVSGSAALVRPTISVSPVPEKTNEDADVFPLDPLPMPKSILKRTGSGMSNRSARSIGVMSLDSGMARLTASLIARGKMKESAGIHKIATKYEKNINVAQEGVEEQFASGSRTHTPELAHLPHLGAQSRRGPSDIDHVRPTAPGLSPSNDPSRVVSISPSKSVTFKLDPEVSRDDRTQAETRLSRQRGGARWSVSFSSQHDQLKGSKVISTAVPEFTVRRSNVRIKEPQRSKLPFDQSVNIGYDESADRMTASEKRKLLLNTYSSSALLRPRPDGGITGVSGLHLMADPYRRYLMERAADEAKRFASVSKTNNSVVPHSRSLNDDASRSAFLEFGRHNTTASLDRNYQFLPPAVYHHAAAHLPALKRKDR